MNEECWVLVGRCQGDAWTLRRCRRTRGSPASVEVDWAWALDREERRGDVAGFWHTHPPGAGASPSLRDLATMQAWCSSLGKPLVCVIAEGARVEGHLFPFADAPARPIIVTLSSVRGRRVIHVALVSKDK